MANYQAGSLDLTITGISTSAVKSINDTVKALNSLYNVLQRINSLNISNVSSNLSNLFKNISNSAKSIDDDALQKFVAIGNAMKTFSSISNLAKLDKVDWDKVANGINNLTIALTPFLTKLQSAQASLTALYGILSKSSGKKIQNLLGGTGSGSQPRGFFGILNISKWIAVYYIARRIGRVVGNIVQEGAEYTETLNLWETAMGDNLSVATEFVNKMNEAYGISEKTLMNAQAIFKNMLGSLGQISDQMAYSLSEGITQMALDYASLYNVTFENAFTKFQAALAGQVRPIRSVSGYDITETTLFQLYQSLGGTKTMRQLNRTEKQLLSILAIFQQMNASGATGDLAKTMESFANQSRVMAESCNEVLSYSGILLTHLIQEAGIMQYVNGVLIFIGETLKAVVDYYGAIQSFGGNVFESTTEGALEASDAIDEVQGKLLDFDKFRSLSGSEENALGLDEKLLTALSSYGTILGQASMEARELAEQFKRASGFFDENGVFQPEKWKEFEDQIIAVTAALGLLIAVKLTQGIISFFVNMVKWFNKTNLSILFMTVGIGLLVYGIRALIDGDIEKGLYAIAGAIVAIGLAISLLTGNWKTMLISGILGALIVVGTLIYKYWDEITDFFVTAWDNAISAIKQGLVNLQNWWIDFMNGVHEFVEFLSFGIVEADSRKKPHISYDDFAVGGMPDKGTVFRAGEAGAEIVYNTPSGQSGVANIQQIAQATYQGTMSALRDWWGGTGAKGDIPQLEEASDRAIYQKATAHAKSIGNTWAKV